MPLTKSELLAAAEAAGYDAGVSGPNTTNCNFGHFATREQTTAWERGKKRGDRARAAAMEDAPDA